MPALFEMILGGIVRHVLQALFVALAAHGYYSQDQAGQIVVGLTGAILMGLWSVWQKVSTSDAIKTIIAAAEARVASAIRGSARTGVAILLPLFLVVGLGAVASGCVHASPKVTVDVADRTAYQTLRAFDVAEETAYHNKAAWPTPAQHQAISVKFSQAYQAVIDVANLGRALQPGATLTVANVAAVSKLAAIVEDLATLVNQPGVSADIQHAYASFEAQASALITAVKGQ